MALLSLKAAHLRFTMAKILMGVDLEIDEGERIGLLGRNGAGKSTLMKVLLGQAELDQGEVIRRAGITVAALPQDVPAWLTGRLAPLLQSVADGVPGLKEWEKKRRIEESMRTLDLSGDEDLTHSSAGTKRRALLSTLMVKEPDVLFLDEPTNHLDIPGIRSLEDWLLNRGGALVFVTHDRRFLRRVATRILDLDRGELRSYTCGYATYLERREEELRIEDETRQQFDKKLAAEEAWVRKGVKAQRGRSAARIAALKVMRAERAVRRDQVGSVQGQIQVAGKTGQLVLRTKNAGVSFDDRPIFRGLTTDLLRGDRLGIIGRNGAGKTTLLKALLLEHPLSEGEVVHGTNLKIGVLDQLHEALRMDASAMDNVLDGATTIPVPGGTKHVLGYLQDFLFTPEQARGPVSRLSGGERNRLALARILARPCNLLVLDEPTNDLDLETMEFLEDLLLNFPGTVILVSHDREFLDEVVTSVLVLDGEGGIQEHVGGYEDRYLKRRGSADEPKEPPRSGGTASKGTDPAKPKKLSFQERRELEGLPTAIEDLEAERARVSESMAAPGFYKQSKDAITKATVRLQVLQAQLEKLMERWIELEQREH